MKTWFPRSTEGQSTRGRRTSPALVGTMIWLVALPALAHHILGIPHYAYDEDYPQTPVLTYRTELGAYEVKMTGYPGKPRPGERCALHVYIRRLDDGTPFNGNVTLTAKLDQVFGRDKVIYGPMDAGLEESIYKFYPRFQHEANYLVRIAFESEGAPYTIDLPMVVGEPGNPWLVLGGVVFGAAAFLVVVRAVRIKMRRRESRTGKPTTGDDSAGDGVLVASKDAAP